MKTFVKFSKKKEYLEELQKGYFFMRGIDYFRELGKRGQGDLNEGILRLKNVNFLMNSLDPKTKYDLRIENCIIKSLKNIPIFCLSYIDDKELEDPKFLCQMKNEFGEYFFKFGAPMAIALDFWNSCRDNDFPFALGTIKYNDFLKSYSLEDIKNIAFRKDLSFEHQQEFRFIINKEFNSIAECGADFFKLKLKSKHIGELYEINSDNKPVLIHSYDYSVPPHICREVAWGA